MGGGQLVSVLQDLDLKLALAANKIAEEDDLLLSEKESSDYVTIDVVPARPATVWR